MTPEGVQGVVLDMSDSILTSKMSNSGQNPHKNHHKVVPKLDFLYRGVDKENRQGKDFGSF